MDLKHYCFFISVVAFAKLLFCLRTPIQVGYFKIVRGHPNIKSCAQQILQNIEGGNRATKEKDYSVEKMQEFTSDCERTENNKPFDGNIAYVKTVSSTKLYSPPFEEASVLMMSDMMQVKSIELVVKQRKEKQNFIVDLDYDISLGGNLHDGKGIVDTSLSGFRFLIVRTNVFDDDQKLWVAVDGSYQKCISFNVTSEQKPRIFLRYQTNTSIEFRIEDSGPCIYNTSLQRGQARQLTTKLEVHSYTEIYNEF